MYGTIVFAVAIFYIKTSRTSVNQYNYEVGEIFKEEIELGWRVEVVTRAVLKSTLISDVCMEES